MENFGEKHLKELLSCRVQGLTVTGVFDDLLPLTPPGVPVDLHFCLKPFVEKTPEGTYAVLPQSLYDTTPEHLKPSKYVIHPNHDQRHDSVRYGISFLIDKGIKFFGMVGFDEYPKLKPPGGGVEFDWFQDKYVEIRDPEGPQKVCPGFIDDTKRPHRDGGTFEIPQFIDMELSHPDD